MSNRDNLFNRKISRRDALKMLSAGSASLYLAGCVVPTPPPATEAPPAAATEAAPAATPGLARPQVGGELVVATWDEPMSLDPLHAAPCALIPLGLICDTLVAQGADLEIHPALAESWEVSPDGTVYTFHLRKGVKFHDGTPFNAEAVKFNLEHQSSPESTASSLLSTLGLYKDTEVVDEYTAKVILEHSAGWFLGCIADGYHSIISPTAAQKYGKDFGVNPVGSGPYTFVEWAPKSHVTVQRWPDYAWGSPLYKNQGPGYFEKVSSRLIPDEAMRMATLETGEVDAAERMRPEDMKRIQGIPSLQTLRRVAPGGPWDVHINTTSFPMDDVRVRQAFIHSIDQDELVQVLWKGDAVPAYQNMSPGTFAYDVIEKDPGCQVHFDAKKANELLDEAGWKMGPDGIREKDGKKLETSVSIVSAAVQAMPIKAMEVVQAQVRRSGFLFNINQYDTGALHAHIVSGGHQMLFACFRSPDPEEWRSRLHSSFIGTSSTNRVWYRDEKLDSLLEAASSEIDVEKRKDLYRQVAQIVVGQALIAPLWHLEDMVGLQANIRDLALYPGGELMLRDVTRAEA